MIHYSTSPFCKNEKFVQQLKQSGYNVVEKGGKTYIDLGNGEKYEVDLTKPAWLILSEIEQAVKKDKNNNIAKRWADSCHKIYEEKTEENKVLNEFMANLKEAIKEAKNKLTPMLRKYNVEHAKDITNPEDRTLALSITDDERQNKKLLDRAGIDFRSNCLTAFNAALDAGNWDLQA